MPTDCISYQNSGYFSPLLIDYLDQKSNLQSLYNRFPTLENFEAQIKEKQINFNENNKKMALEINQHPNSVRLCVCLSISLSHSD